MSSITQKIKYFFYIIIGTGFGLGLSPIMPGTCGALVGVAFHIIIFNFLPSDYHLSALIIVFLSVCIANHALYNWARNYWNQDDPQHFILDEIAGYLLVPILIRFNEFWPSVILGFLLFRAFDIIKLPIARQIDQKMHNSWGVILDDLVSALYAVIAMVIISWVTPYEIVNI